MAKYNLYMASEGGHDASKYALAILYICGGKVLDYMIGTTWPKDLWQKRCLLKCRRKIKEAIKLEGFWPEKRTWTLDFSRVGHEYRTTCTPPKLREGVWVATSNEDYTLDTCIYWHLAEEVKWFVEELGCQAKV